MIPGMNPMMGSMMNTNMISQMFSPSQMKSMQDKLLNMSEHVLKGLEAATGQAGLADKYKGAMAALMGRKDIAHGGCCKPHTPAQGMQNAVTIDLNRAGKHAHSMLKNTGFSVGGFESMLIDSKIDGSSKRGGFLGLGRNKSQRRAKAFEAKTNPKSPSYDANFTRQVERSLGGKIVPGSIDGKLTIIPTGNKLPFLGGGSISSYTNAGAAPNLITGLSKMMQNVAGIAATLGGGGIGAALGGGGGRGLGIAGAIGGLWAGNQIGSFLSPQNVNSMKLSARKTLGIENRPGGAMSKLPPNPTFEQLMAALLFDFVKDRQDEVKKEVQEMKAKADKKNSLGSKLKQGIGGMLPMIGSVAGMAFGPLGSMVGGALGSMGQNLAGTGAQSEESKTLQMEEIKQKMNEITEMIQALGNILKSLHDSAMTSIRNVK